MNKLNNHSANRSCQKKPKRIIFNAVDDDNFQFPVLYNPEIIFPDFSKSFKANEDSLKNTNTESTNSLTPNQIENMQDDANLTAATIEEVKNMEKTKEEIRAEKHSKYMQMLKERINTKMDPVEADDIFRELNDKTFVNREAILRAIVNAIREKLEISLTSIAEIVGRYPSYIYRVMNKTDENAKEEPGRPPYLTDQQEQDCVAECIDAYMSNDPFTPRELAMHLRDKYQMDFSSTYVYALIGRWSSKIKAKYAKPVETQRAEISVKTVDDWIKTLKEGLQNVSAHLLFSVDETGCQMWANAKKKKVICPVEIEDNKVTYSVKRDGAKFSIICAIPLRGNAVKPFIITKRLSVETHLFKHSICKDDLYIIHSDSAYCNTYTFKIWLEEVFIPHLNRIRVNNMEKCVIIMDGFKAHTRGSILEICNANNIKLIIIPPHSSHLLQPLDLNTFAHFKRDIYSVNTYFDSEKFTGLVESALLSYQLSTVPMRNYVSFLKAGITWEIGKTPKTCTVDETILENLKKYCISDEVQAIIDRKRADKEEKGEKMKMEMMSAQKFIKLKRLYIADDNDNQVATKKIKRSKCDTVYNNLSTDDKGNKTSIIKSKYEDKKDVDALGKIIDENYKSRGSSYSNIDGFSLQNKKIVIETDNSHSNTNNKFNHFLNCQESSKKQRTQERESKKSFIVEDSEDEYDDNSFTDDSCSTSESISDDCISEY